MFQSRRKAIKTNARSDIVTPVQKRGLSNKTTVTDQPLHRENEEDQKALTAAKNVLENYKQDFEDLE